MKNILIFAACVALSFQVFATEPQYPDYKSAAGIKASTQVELEARWLDLNANHLGGVVIPKSFNVSAYWPYMVSNNMDYQTYLKDHDQHNCFVPQNHSNDATIERTMQQQGLDIYDGAVWQIALAIASKKNPEQYLPDVINYTQFLTQGVEGGFQSYRAYQDRYYNGNLMPSAKNAYILKFLSPSYAFNYDEINDCTMNWPEWSAVTGEEAWAVFVGPVQSIYIINDGANNPTWSSSAQAGNFIDLGKNALGAIQQMQSPSGGVYRDVPLPNVSQSLNISLENNFSLYAGLSLFEEALKARDAIYQKQLNAGTLETSQQSTIQEKLDSDKQDIATVNTIKQGIVKFLSSEGGVTVFDSANNYFYSSVDVTTPNTKDFAVDVQTWGASVIASIKKDPNDSQDPDLYQAMINAYGKDVIYNIFETALTKGAYSDTQGNLLGVGYTAQTSSDDFYELSGEWTLGAINAGIILADHYQNDANKVNLLIAQTKNMVAGVMKEASSVEGEPSSKTARLNYLYANKRVLIPFGWYSNKAPSTASTAWSLMVNSCFNPFELGGGNHQAICQKIIN